MSPVVTRALTLLGAVLVLAGVNASILHKERVVRTGQTM